PGSAADVLRRGQYRLRPDRPRLLLRHDGARQKQGFAFGPRNGAHFHWICVRVGHARRPPSLLALSRRGGAGEEHKIWPTGLSRHARPERHHSRKLQTSEARRSLPCRRIIRARREAPIARPPLFTPALVGALPRSIWRAASHTARP